MIVCENCGEDNLVGNSTCSSCGINLKGHVVDSRSDKLDKKKQKEKKLENTGKKFSKETSQINKGKELDGKKIFLISSIIASIIIITPILNLSSGFLKASF